MEIENREKWYNWVRKYRDSEKQLVWKYGVWIKTASIIDPFLDCCKITHRKPVRYVFDHSSNTDVRYLSSKVKRKIFDLDKQIKHLKEQRENILRRNINKMKPISNKAIFLYRQRRYKEFRELNKAAIPTEVNS